MTGRKKHCAIIRMMLFVLYIKNSLQVDIYIFYCYSVDKYTCTMLSVLLYFLYERFDTFHIITKDR